MPYCVDREILPELEHTINFSTDRGGKTVNENIVEAVDGIFDDIPDNRVISLEDRIIRIIFTVRFKIHPVVQAY